MERSGMRGQPPPDFALRAPSGLRLLWFDARELHHLGPLLGFGRYKIAELRGADDHWDRAGVGEPCHDGWACQACIDVAIQPRDDLRRRALWHTDSCPCPCLVSRKRLGNARHVWKHVKSVFARYAERPQRAS